jgi:nucleotide-binding universal stress UspA family protein
VQDTLFSVSSGAPREIDGFRLENLVHEGGMAAIWRVSHPAHDLPMVMKIPLLRHGENPVTAVSFEVERMILPRLSGPHVPRFVAAGDFERPYIVMEHVDGSTLRARLDATPLPPEEVARTGLVVAEALEALHGQRVWHLDVKPSNVIVRPSGEGVLIDFGLSHHAALPDLLAEEFYVPIGTGPYISPEQVLRRRGDPRSDLFALGVILYFFVTGERPFGDPVRAREWRRRLWRDPVPPRARRPEIPPWLQEVVLRCLEVDPAARYPSAAALAADLREPQRIVLTPRAHRLHRDGARVVMRRWLRTRADVPARRAARRPPSAPLVMAAVDLGPAAAPLAGALRVAVARILDGEPGARLACVTVLKLARFTADEFEDASGRNHHLLYRGQLEQWARPLHLAPERVTYHVLESPDPAAALLDYARENVVDHVVMGARASSTLRRYLGSVSSEVVAKASCTVTVVRGTAAAPPVTCQP